MRLRQPSNSQKLLKKTHQGFLDDSVFNLFCHFGIKKCLIIYKVFTEGDISSKDGRRLTKNSFASEKTSKTSEYKNAKKFVGSVCWIRAL